MHSDLYKVDNYQCFYSPKLEGKKIGTGVALHVNDSFKVTILVSFVLKRLTWITYALPIAI